MIGVAVSALVLRCFFNPPADGSVSSGSVPRITMPVSGALAEGISAGRPPLSTNHFAGESGQLREWAFGSNTDTAVSSFKLLRVSLADENSLPSPYAARYGTAFVAIGGGQPKFETEMTGYCQLQSSDGAKK